MPTVLVGSIAHELHSFVPGTTGMAQFDRHGIAEGGAVLEELDGTSIGGALEEARHHDIDLLPTLSAFGSCGPPVEEEVFAELRDRLLDGIRATDDRFEAVYLPLHGAMATTERDDPEGDLILAIRSLAGSDRPIVVSLDLHAHVTDRMVAGADAIVGYRTCPHTDIWETGVRSMHLLAEALAGRIRPTTAQRKIRLLASSEAHDTTDGPLAVFQARARDIERQPGVVSVSIFATQPWMDLPGTGWSVTVTTDDDHTLAQQQADVLARALWEGRDGYQVVKTPITDALQRADDLRAEPGPLIAADGADSPSAGANGDGTALLGEIVARNVDLHALMVVTDPAAVALASEAGPRGSFESTLGGRLTPQFFAPTRVRAEVLQVTDGRYRSTYPPVPVDAGMTAVLRVRNTRIVVTEHPVYQLDLEPYRRLGLEPSEFDLVQAKSAGGFRAHYGPTAADIIDLDTRGPCDSDLPRLPYRRLTRPMWPFDPALEEAW